jgi:hypothetical protein
MPDTTPFGDPTTDILDLSLPQNFLQQDVGRYAREIEGIDIPHVVVEEDHDDELIITQHPVEFGAIISDHAYKKPSEVRMRCCWNNSGSHYLLHGKAYTQKPVVVSGYEGYARAIYDQILALQLSRKPFSVITGKRIYKDMLVANVRVHTAPGSEYSLMADIVLREVILVATKTITLDTTNSRMKDGNNQVNSGQKEAQATPNVAVPIAVASGVAVTDENVPT